MLDGADDLVDLVCKGDRVFDGRVEVHVNEVAVVVADSDLVAVDLIVGGAALAEDGLGTLHGWERLEAPHSVFDAEREALDGQREVGSHLVDNLGLVDDDNEFVGRGLDDLLAEEGATSTLHEVEVASIWSVSEKDVCVCM